MGAKARKSASLVRRQPPKLFGVLMIQQAIFPNWALANGELVALVEGRVNMGGDLVFIGRLRTSGVYLLNGKPRKTPRAAARDIAQYLSKLYEAMVLFIDPL